MSKSNETTIEKTYQKKTQLEHILLRPDTYIGTTEHITEKLWVLSPKETLINKQINYVPGLYKIFDEILVNAIDNITRDLRMSLIKVDINSKSISIYNNGKGIPITIHKTYKIYVPELIFGHLLTSSNYDDSQKKVTGGRNGFGAKLTNVFSKKFIVETAEKKNKKLFKMEFYDNMTKHNQPEIINNYDGEDYTKITFEPDFKKFKMNEMDDDIISLMKKRVYDVAGTTPERINVYLNGKKIKISKFSDYIDLYIKNRYFDEENKIEYPKLIYTANQRWEIAFSMTDGTSQQVSFVNGICTSKGGTHVNYILDQVTDRIAELVKKKNKDVKINTNQIKQNIWVFINCLIENPSFNSQTKETLTTKIENFGSKCELTEKFIKEFLKSTIVTNIIEFAKAKSKIKLHKALSSNIKRSSRLLGIEKLEDANLAGTKDYKDCTLILTEGDSAKALALSGIEVVGRDTYGVFPLRGKVLNVRGAKDSQIIKNEEIQNIIKILGLKIGMDYSDELKGMRYGHLLIMTDQDYDGSHIKGLIINFIHFFWPSLIKRGDFLQEFITPIVKATKENLPTQTFFTIKEYTDWYNNNKHNGYKIKYYKGLGTSTSKEAKEYFSNIKKLKLSFKYINEEDDKAIILGFEKSDSEARKEWLLNFDQFNTFLDQSKGTIRYKNFINEELIFFSFYDNIRSIPSMMDGLKPSERKILFSCFKRNLKNEMKVAQLIGYVAENSSYHHGEQSLGSTITALAQDFVGSNNLNLLLPKGQFGNRYNGTKGAASPRYIYTTLNPISRLIFNENDDNLLLYNVDEGLKIEPVWYVPIIPMVLVNGAEGIGTGWSTFIPEFNPIEIARNLIRKINNESYIDMKPWYKGFSGEIKEVNNKGKSYVVNGKININLDEKLIEISELPIREFTRDYKSFLEKMHVDNKEYNGNRDFIVEDIKEYHTDNKILFNIKLSDDSFNNIKDKSYEDLLKIFKLSTTLSISNMVLFDSNNKIKKYNNVEEIFDEFYKVRLEYYEKRKNYLLNKIGYALEKNENKKKFITLFLNGVINFRGRSRKDILKLLKENKLKTNKELKKIYQDAFKINSTEIIVSNDDTEHIIEDSNEENDLDYDYLMNMNIWSLTPEKINELDNIISKERNEYDILNKNSPSNLWKEDLEKFIDEYNKIINEIEGKNIEAESKIKTMKNSSRFKNKKKKNNKVTKKKKNEDSFIDDDESESENEEISIYDDDDSENGNKNLKTNKKKKNSEEKNSNEKKKKNIKTTEKKINNKNSNSKNNNSNNKSSTNFEEEIIKINEDEENLVPGASNILKKLNIKEITPTKDKTKLTLKERLAMRAKQGTIEQYLSSLNNKEEKKEEKKNNSNNKKKNEINIDKTLEDIDVLLGKKTNSSNKKISTKSNKKVKSTNKKKKIVDDENDDDDDYVIGD